MWIVIVVLVLLLFGLAEEEGKRSLGTTIAGGVIWLIIAVLLISSC